MSASEKDRPAVDREEQAALAALTMLPVAERAGVPRDLVEEMREAAALLAEVVDPVPPPPSLRNRLLAGIASYESLKPLADVRSHDEDWIDSGMPGVDVKILFRDRKSRRTTMLLRMTAGAHLPAHRHHDDEQCLVVSGDIRWGDIVYREGDFVVMGRDTTHPMVHTVGGNILLLVAGHNEYVQS
ncbi:MAG: cupin domain-containing protein [Bryobacteraceae bacterium]|jgi:quercetin dioxygenase-like cupin family protein